MKQPMIKELRGRSYSCTLASDLDGDGMGLELVDDAGPSPELVLEAFYSDRTHEMTFTAHRAELPFELVEWFVTLARQRLPPKEDE